MSQASSNEPILTTRRDSIAVVVLNNPAKLNARTVAMWARLRDVMHELLLEGRIFDAAEACNKGLVNRVVPDTEVEREAFATAERIAAGAPLVARWHKQFIERLTTRANVTPDQWDEAFACFDTEDFREGVDAFVGKRKPRFAGT